MTEETKRGDIVVIRRTSGFNPYDLNTYRVVSVEDSGFVHLYDDANEQNAYYHTVNGPKRGYTLCVTNSFGEATNVSVTPTKRRLRLTEIRSDLEGRPQIARLDAVYGTPYSRFSIGDRVLARETDGGLRVTLDGYSEVWPCTHVRKKRTKNKK